MKNGLFDQFHCILPTPPAVEAMLVAVIFGGILMAVIMIAIRNYGGKCKLKVILVLKTLVI